MGDKHLLHWFELRENTILYLNEGILTQLLNRAKQKAGNINQLSRRIGFSSPSLYGLESGKYKGITVKKLYNLVKYLEEDPKSLNAKI